MKRFKQLRIDGDQGSCCCDWKYIEKNREEVYEKTLKRAGSNPKFWIVDWEGEAGRSVQHGEYKSRTICEREVSQEFIENLLKKN